MATSRFAASVSKSRAVQVDDSCKFHACARNRGAHDFSRAKGQACAWRSIDHFVSELVRGTTMLQGCNSLCFSSYASETCAWRLIDPCAWEFVRVLSRVRSCVTTDRRLRMAPHAGVRTLRVPFSRAMGVLVSAGRPCALVKNVLSVIENFHTYVVKIPPASFVIQ